MQVDTTTEEIWHFIGAFHQRIEAARDRAEHDAFRAQKAEAAQVDLAFLNGTLSHVHRLPDFTPGVQIAATPSETPGLPLFPVAFLPLQMPQIDAFFPPQAEALVYGAALGPAQAQRFITLQLPAPSVVVILAQENIAWDQDIYLQQEFGLTFTPFSALDAQVQMLLGLASGLEPFGPIALPADTAAIKTIAWQVADDVANVFAGDHATVLRGPEVSGGHVNGQAASAPDDPDLPVLEDYLPEVPVPLALVPGAELADEITAAASVEPMHVAVTGGNTLVNQVSLTVSWLDAPVMLVMGEALSLDFISQVNVLSEHVVTNGASPASSQMFNIAQFAVDARPLPELAPDQIGTFPSLWNVTTLQADIVNLNWMDQTNFLIDHDIAAFSWSGASTFLRLGDNSLLNVGSLLEIGLGYDLIVIGGDIVTLNLIQQTNVLLDADWVMTGDATMQVNAGGNLLWNAAAITGTGTNSYTPLSETGATVAAHAANGSSGAMPHSWLHPAFEGIGTLNVLYIAGDYLTMAMIRQTNILGDADQVAALAAQTELATGVEALIVTGSNALVNLAAINTVGMDSEIQVAGEIYSDALLYQASFIDADAADPYAANGPAALSSEAVLFLADGMLTPDDDAGVSYGDITLTQGQLDGVNAVLA